MRTRDHSAKARKVINLTPDLKALIQEYADNNHGGNFSHAIRELTTKALARSSGGLVL